MPQLTRLKNAGADCLFLVGNVGPSAQVVKSLDRMGWKPPIVSHWGPAGGRFTELAGPSAQRRALRADLQLLRQAVAGGREGAEGADGEVSRHQGRRATSRPAVGVANAYDAMMLAALAIKNAGSTDGPNVREGFYKIAKYEGLIKTYNEAVHARQPRRDERERLRLDAVHR